MFAATKLRKGMIPEDKEKGGGCGTLSHEEKFYVSPPPLVNFLFVS